MQLNLSSPIFMLAVVGYFIGGSSVDRSFARKGGHSIVPASFSFGWYRYVVEALWRLCNHATLMPKPNVPFRVFNLDNVTSQDNQSWLISQYLQEHTRTVNRQLGKQEMGIRIMIFEANRKCNPSGYRIHLGQLLSTSLLLAQFGTSVIPGYMRSDWGVFFINLYGILLSYWIGCLPQWKAEKSPHLQPPNHTYALTSSKGDHDVLVLRCYDEGVNFEDLARGHHPSPSLAVRLFHMIPFVLSLSLLHTVLTLETDQTALAIVGILGMVDNVISTWLAQSPYEWDFDLNLVDTVSDTDGMRALTYFDISHGDGTVLLREFFPANP